MITKELMERLFPVRGLNPRKYNLVRERGKLIDALNRILPKYEIDSHLRICAFLANCGVETDYFRTTSEYATGWDYDVSVNPAKARSLGNFHKGDGPRYKGGGLTQTTGKNNYEAVQEAIGEQLGIDVVKNPEILRGNVAVAVESACIFWRDNHLNVYADRGLFKQLSAIVNRGDRNKTPLHWAKRSELYALLKLRVPKDFSFPVAIGSRPAMATVEPVTSQNYDDPARLGDADVAQSASQPLVVPAAVPGADDSFLAAAFDKNVSADEARQMAKNALPSFGARLWKFLVRPLMWIYAALEAGNIAAWLGIVVTLAVVVYVVYLNRAKIRLFWAAVKTKVIQ